MRRAVTHLETLLRKQHPQILGAVDSMSMLETREDPGAKTLKPRSVKCRVHEKQTPARHKYTINLRKRALGLRKMVKSLGADSDSEAGFRKQEPASRSDDPRNVLQVRCLMPSALQHPWREIDARVVRFRVPTGQPINDLPCAATNVDNVHPGSQFLPCVAVKQLQ